MTIIAEEMQTLRDLVHRISQQPHASTCAVEEPKCKRCKDYRWLDLYVPVGHPDFGKFVRCPECNPGPELGRLRERCGLSEFERQRRLVDIETEGRPGTAQMVAACREFLSDPTRILTIWGGVGNGKTMALQAVVNECNARSHEAVYVTAFDLLGSVTEAYDRPRGEPGDGAYKRLVRFSNIQVLVIDEFDKRTDTKWVSTQVGNLLEMRCRLAEAERAGTLIAMNADPALQPEWIASRLLDGRNHVVHNEDSDIRSALRA
jgi:hypothetical protein